MIVLEAPAMSPELLFILYLATGQFAGYDERNCQFNPALIGYTDMIEMVQAATPICEGPPLPPQNEVDEAERRAETKRRLEAMRQNQRVRNSGRRR